MVKIRLQRQGKKKAPFYHIVVADSKSPRDGKIIEKIGTYNPMTDPATICLDQEKVATWIKNGAKPTECKKLMAYVPDTPILDPYLTGLQYLNFICDIYSVSKEKRQQKIPALSKKLGMYEKLNDLISSYSHGMKQKVSLIGAFIHEPKLLILDEPFVALDPEAFIQLKELMKELCASGGSVLFSSHILDVVEKTCNKIAIIRNGELIRSGETKEILGNRDLENVFMELNGK